MHAHAFALAVRLLRGKVAVFTDERGRRWLATADALSRVLVGDAGPIIEGTAGDVAIEVVRRWRARAP
jgi:hypothetical protein